VGGVTTMQKVTVTATLGTNTLNIAWVSGTNEIVLIDAYNSAAKKVRVLPGGKSGATSGDLDELTAPGWGVPALVSKLKPKLMTLNIGINDWEGSVATSTYQTNITSLVNAQSAQGDTLLIGPNSTGSVASEATQLTYISVLQSLASSLGLTMRNIRSNGANWATYAAANTAGLMFADGLHPNAAGYAQIGPYVAVPLLVGV
jgi:lysophospholipase L1-like esterase